jgi:hypothetical protein
MNDLQMAFAKFIKEKIIRPMLKKEGYKDDIIDSVEVTFND